MATSMKPGSGAGSSLGESKWEAERLDRGSRVWWKKYTTGVSIECEVSQRIKLLIFKSKTKNLLLSRIFEFRRILVFGRQISKYF